MRTSLALAGLVITASMAAAHEGGDILVDLVDGRLVTGTVDEDGSNPEVGERVFGAEFEDPMDIFTDEPGHKALPGTFDPSGRNGFNILSALKMWTGSGFIGLDALTEETMEISFGSLVRKSTNGFVSGFFLNNDADGGWHRHLGFRLNGKIGDEWNPRLGIYMLELELKNDDSTIGNSLPYYIIFNYGMDEEYHDAAIDYQRDVVPEPATLTVMALGAAMLRRRKR